MEIVAALAPRMAHVDFHVVGGSPADLTRWLETVQSHYVKLFEDSPELTAQGANMVFAGEADDPRTIAALAAMGYEDPSRVIALVRGWHHGRYPAIRTPRARELLTEMQPVLIEALSRTADPDLAILSFDRFMSELPSGVQLFSLFRANPSLLRLLCDLMGSAPRLARHLRRAEQVFSAIQPLRSPRGGYKSPYSAE